MSPFELVSSICLVRLEINPIYDPSNLVGRIRTYHRAYKLAFEWGVEAQKNDIVVVMLVLDEHVGLDFIARLELKCHKSKLIYVTIHTSNDNITIKENHLR